MECLELSKECMKEKPDDLSQAIGKQPKLWNYT
nr:MAG TPA: hypothetical protein [Herelleviridae sp.]